jgi:hypothetical protein
MRYTCEHSHGKWSNTWLRIRSLCDRYTPGRRMANSGASWVSRNASCSYTRGSCQPTRVRVRVGLAKGVGQSSCEPTRARAHCRELLCGTGMGSEKACIVLHRRRANGSHLRPVSHFKPRDAQRVQYAARHLAQRLRALQRRVVGIGGGGVRVAANAVAPQRVRRLACYGVFYPAMQRA